MERLVTMMSVGADGGRFKLMKVLQDLLDSCLSFLVVGVVGIVLILLGVFLLVTNGNINT